MAIPEETMSMHEKSRTTAFEHMEIERMDAGFYSVNIGSRKALLNAGYKIEGERNDFFQLEDGSRCNDIEVGLIRNEYEMHYGVK